MTGEPGKITQLLGRFRHGDREAEGELLPVVYGELRRLAENNLRRERRNHTLSPSALVHEAYLRLAGSDQPDWHDRAHFFAVAARVMRQVLVDYARRRQAHKRGASFEIINVDAELPFAESKSSELLALDEVLNRLELQDTRQSKIVEMKFFAGLTFEDIADILGVSSKTVKREWTMARAWLHREIGK